MSGQVQKNDRNLGAKNVKQKNNICFSIDPPGVKLSKPNAVVCVSTLLRVYDAFVCTFKVGDRTVPFHLLSNPDKVEVFKATGSLPEIKNGQIRIYWNSALYS